MRILPIVLLASALHAQAQQTSVLFLGNSYTTANDLPYMFRQIALSFGDTVSTGVQAPGGYTLVGHADDPATLAAIASQQWDYVVLQEQSQLGALPTSEGFTDVGAAELAYAMNGSSECAYPVFYMTWGRKNGDQSNCLWYPFMCTYDSMQQALRDNYIQLALDNEGYVSPVGWAWKHVRDTHPNIELYQPDESHPSVSGTYLAACVFYCTLFRQSCVGSSFVSTLQPDSAAILQAIASATVLDSMDTWNLNEIGSTDATVVTMSSDFWNEITMHHFGQGSHWWICSNGQTSNDANPTFTFDAGGIYTFTHVYIDPCGHMDTDTWTIQVNGVGIADGDVLSHFTVWSPDASLVEVTGGKGTEEFTLFDLQGRTIVTRRLDADRMRIPCPKGLHLFRIVDRSGAVHSGKVLVE